MRRPLSIALIGLLLAGAGPAFAHSDDPIENAVKYRQALFTVMRWNFAPLAAMARDKKPYDPSEARLRASRLFSISRQLEEGFPAGSGPESGHVMDAKAEIWQNRADFDAKLEELQVQTRATREVARSGDAEAFKAQFQRLAASCKACHDDYRDD